jgi:hypothetical protein
VYKYLISLLEKTAQSKYEKIYPYVGLMLVRVIGIKHINLYQNLKECAFHQTYYLIQNQLEMKMKQNNMYRI